MTKKQIATVAAGLLTLAAGLLSQCPDEPAQRQGSPIGADAGAR